MTSAGVIPTPAVAFLTASLGFDAGVVISASHNPFEDNGIKVFSKDGLKLNDASERELEACVLDQSWQMSNGMSSTLEDGKLADRYLQYIRRVLPEPGRLRSIRLAIDCAHGATTPVASGLFRSLGCQLDVLGCDPDGRNINRDCGSTHPETLATLVTERGCDLGVAFDGDGDRAIFVDAQGQIVNGDAVLLICATHLKSAGRLRGNAVVATVMSNVGLELAFRSLGIELVRCAVGDKYVIEEMQARGLVLGGEQSGHIIFAEMLRTGDGLLTALMVLRALVDSGRTLADLAGDLHVLPQVLVNVPVRQKTDLEALPDLVALMGDIERRLAGHGRLLVRYSGTEPLLRVMVEGEDRGQIDAWAEEIAVKVRERLGTPEDT